MLSGAMASKRGSSLEKMGSCDWMAWGALSTCVADIRLDQAME